MSKVKLSEREMLNYGEKISNFRKALRERALNKDEEEALIQQQEISSISDLSVKIGRGYFRGVAKTRKQQVEDFLEDIPVPCRKVNKGK